jgi:hypothetical protein
MTDKMLTYFRKQVRTLGKYFSLSFVWAFFQWFYTAGDDCGFNSFPTLGLEAYKNRLAWLHLGSSISDTSLRIRS